MAAVDVAAAPSPWRFLRMERLVPKLGLLVFVAALGYLTVLPLVRLQVKAFEHGANSYTTAFRARGIWTAVRYTVELGFGSTVIAIVVGTALGWAANALSPRLQLLKIVPILPIVIPAVAYVLGWSFLLSPVPGYLNAILRHLPWWHGVQGPANVYTVPWMVIIVGISLASFVYLFVSAGLEGINNELIEAAYIGGSGRTGAFFKVTLPLLRPALVYGGGVALLLGLGQFTAPLLLGRNELISTLTTNMYFQTQAIPPEYGQAAALGSPLLIVGVIILVLNRVLLGDHTRFITHGGKGGFKPVERGSKTAAGFILVYFLVSTVLPIIALAIVSVSKFWTASVHPSQWTLANYRQVTTASGVTSAILNSVYYSLIAMAIALPLGFLAAWYLRKRHDHRIIGPILDFVVAMPLSIPAVIFGVGFLLTYTTHPLILYGSKWVLILVYVTLMVPFSTRMQLAGMAALGDAYVEASRVSGAGPVRTTLKIIAPLLRPTFGGAAALMFVLLTHEFAASLLVRGPKTQVMGTILYDYYENGSYPLVAVISLIMIGVTTIGVLAAVAVSGSEVFKKL